MSTSHSLSPGLISRRECRRSLANCEQMVTAASLLHISRTKRLLRYTIRVRFRRSRTSDDPSARLVALRALPVDQTSRGAFLVAVDDPSLIIAREAVGLVGEVGGQREAGELRKRILRADLGLVPSLCQALLRLGHASDSVKVAEDGVQSELPSTRLKAIIALGELGDRDAAPVLERACEDRIAGVRKAALVSLAKLDPTHNRKSAFTRALTDVDPLVRGAAVRALLAAVPDLAWAKTLVRDDDASVRVELALGAHKLGLDLIQVLGNDVQASVRECLAWSLAREPRRDAIGSLVKLLHDDVWQVRRAACRALGSSGVTTAHDALRARLVDPHQTVRAAASTTLALVFRISSPPSSTTTTSCMSSGSASGSRQASKDHSTTGPTVPKAHNFFYQAEEPGTYSRRQTGLHHLAFLVASRAVVREAHQWACAREAIILDEPREFPQYGEHVLRPTGLIHTDSN